MELSYMSYMLYIILWLVNFCEDYYRRIRTSIEHRTNMCLRGRVLYYAMYSKKEPYYAILYDYTSLWQRILCILYGTIWMKYLDNKNIFKFDDVSKNIENLSHFLIDCVVITYVDENAHTKHRLLTYQGLESETTQNIPQSIDNASFIYAIATDSTGVEHNLTSQFNVLKNDILTTKTLLVGDIVNILVNRKNETLPAIDGLVLRTMLDNDFEDMVYKDKDHMYCKTLS